MAFPLLILVAAAGFCAEIVWHRVYEFASGVPPMPPTVLVLLMAAAASLPVLWATVALLIKCRLHARAASHGTS